MDTAPMGLIAAAMPVVVVVAIMAIEAATTRLLLLTAMASSSPRMVPPARTRLLRLNPPMVSLPSRPGIRTMSSSMELRVLPRMLLCPRSLIIRTTPPSRISSLSTVTAIRPSITKLRLPPATLRLTELPRPMLELPQPSGLEFSRLQPLMVHTAAAVAVAVADTTIALQATPVTPAAAPGPYPYQVPPPYTTTTPHPTAPYMPPSPAPPSFDGRSGFGPRHHGRGGLHNHNNNRSRPHQGGDRNKPRNFHNQNKSGPGQNNKSNNDNKNSDNQHQKSDGQSAGKKKKRKTNTLGLTPGEDSDNPSDVEDEEQRLNAIIGADAPNPTTSEEISAWIAERKARYPTLARETARQAKEAEAKELEKKAEELRRELLQVESSIKRKREQQDEGDDMRGSADASSPSAANNNNNNNIKDDDDEGPEVMSTRQGPSNDNVPPPPRKADPAKHCKYFSTGGHCGKRGKCRFVHDPAVREKALREREMNGGRPTLMQRLIMHERDQEDMVIVRTLKYLQDKGLLPKKNTAAASEATQTEAKPAENDEVQTQEGVLPEQTVSATETTTEEKGDVKPEETGETKTAENDKAKTEQAAEAKAKENADGNAEANAEISSLVKDLVGELNKEPGVETPAASALSTTVAIPNGLPPRPVASFTEASSNDAQPIHAGSSPTTSPAKLPQERDPRDWHLKAPLPAQMTAKPPAQFSLPGKTITTPDGWHYLAPLPAPKTAKPAPFSLTSSSMPAQQLGWIGLPRPQTTIQSTPFPFAASPMVSQPQGWNGPSRPQTSTNIVHPSQLFPVGGPLSRAGLPLTVYSSGSATRQTGRTDGLPTTEHGPAVPVHTGPHIKIEPESPNLTSTAQLASTTHLRGGGNSADSIAPQADKAKTKPQVKVESPGPGFISTAQSQQPQQQLGTSNRHARGGNHNRGGRGRGGRAQQRGRGGKHWRAKAKVKVEKRD
ncbi:hypothetical protein VTJ49DRAFT_1070 [Mycothermus thermophilus]|uniref:C3H1-type domain-containing protein n=1 Tax=Humicola insolens TaxID=85995 RepID=A0ABR3VDP0_HUMIN